MFGDRKLIPKPDDGDQTQSISKGLKIGIGQSNKPIAWKEYFWLVIATFGGIGKNSRDIKLNILIVQISFKAQSLINFVPYNQPGFICYCRNWIIAS